jgi:hypothetical protein
LQVGSFFSTVHDGIHTRVSHNLSIWGRAADPMLKRRLTCELLDPMKIRGRRIPRKDGKTQEGGTVVIVSDVVSHVYLT